MAKKEKKDDYVGNIYKETAYGFYHNNNIDITTILVSSLPAQ